MIIITSVKNAANIYITVRYRAVKSIIIVTLLIYFCTSFFTNYYSNNNITQETQRQIDVNFIIEIIMRRYIDIYSFIFNLNQMY